MRIEWEPAREIFICLFSIDELIARQINRKQIVDYAEFKIGKKLMEALKELLSKKSDKATIIVLAVLAGIVWFSATSEPPKSELDIIAEESAKGLANLEACLSGETAYCDHTPLTHQSPKP